MVGFGEGFMNLNIIEGGSKMATEGKLMEIPEDMKALMFQTWLPTLMTTLLALMLVLNKPQ